MASSKSAFRGHARESIKRKRNNGVYVETAAAAVRRYCTTKIEGVAVVSITVEPRQNDEPRGREVPAPAPAAAPTPPPRMARRVRYSPKEHQSAASLAYMQGGLSYLVFLARGPTARHHQLVLNYHND